MSLFARGGIETERDSSFFSVAVRNIPIIFLPSRDEPAVSGNQSIIHPPPRVHVFLVVTEITSSSAPRKSFSYFLCYVHAQSLNDRNQMLPRKKLHVVCGGSNPRFSPPMRFYGRGALFSAKSSEAVH